MEAKREAEFTITQLKSLNASVQEKLHMEELKILELQQEQEHDEDKLSVLIDETTQMKLLEQGMVTHEKEMEKKVHDLHEENKTHKKRIEELESEIESGSNLRNHLKETISELEIQIEQNGRCTQSSKNNLDKRLLVFVHKVLWCNTFYNGNG